MSITRDVTTVGAGTLTSRLLGFLRDAGVAAMLGAGALSDAYFAALQIPNLFRRLLAEGALNSAFVPMSMRIRDENGAVEARRFSEQVLGVMAASLFGLALLCVVFAPAIVHMLTPGFRGEGSDSLSRSSLSACRCLMSQCPAWWRSRRPPLTQKAGSRRRHSASWYSTSCSLPSW